MDELLDVWILTMPTYLGYEGMNPLTVYFAYKKDGSPWLVLLEVCNNIIRGMHVFIDHVYNRSITPSTNVTSTFSK